MCYSTLYLHVLPSLPTAITHLKEMALASSRSSSCVCELASLDVEYSPPKQHPRETSHMVTDILSLFVSFFYLSFLSIFHLSAIESLSLPLLAKKKLGVDCAVISSPALFISLLSAWMITLWFVDYLTFLSLVNPWRRTPLISTGLIGLGFNNNTCFYIWSLLIIANKASLTTLL